MYKDFQLPRHSCRNIYQTQYIMRIVHWWKQKHMAAQYIDKLERVAYAGWHSQFLPCLLKLQGSFKCPLRLWTCMDFVVLVFLPIYARK